MIITDSTNSPTIKCLNTLDFIAVRRSETRVDVSLLNHVVLEKPIAILWRQKIERPG